MATWKAAAMQKGKEWQQPRRETTVEGEGAAAQLEANNGKRGEITMKKSYKIEVDCANCAAKMEEAAGKTEGVASAVVNFMTQKMIVEFNEGADPKATMKAVLNARCKGGTAQGRYHLAD